MNSRAGMKNGAFCAVQGFVAVRAGQSGEPLQPAFGMQHVILPGAGQSKQNCHTQSLAAN